MPEGERSIQYPLANHPEDLLSDEEKWRRIIANRKEQGRAFSRWESGGKKLV